MLPVFLLGALSDLIRVDLGVGEAAIGAAVTALFATAAVAATLVGRVTERIGAGAALRSGVLVAAAATAGVGLLAGGYLQLLALVAVCGIAVCFVDTGAALAFSDRVPATRQGSAFGIKEASIPAASLLAGVALPTLAGAFGWRAVFTAALGLAAVVLVALPRAPGRGRGRSSAVAPAATASRGTVPVEPAGGGASSEPAGGGASPEPVGRGRVDRTTVLFAVGVGFGTGAATAAATFLVPALTRTGVAAGTAGTVLAVASLASITARVLVGRWADRPSARPARAVAALLGGGTVGAVTLAAAGPLPMAVAVAGAVVVLAAGWGWTGLAFLAVVRARPAAPAAAAGVVLTGLSGGGALGPLAFGALADVAGYPWAWTVAAAALATGAAATGLASRGLDLAPTRT